VLKGHPRCIAYEGVYSTDYKLLSETFGTYVFPKMKNGLQPKKIYGFEVIVSTYLRVSLALPKHGLVSNS